MPLGNCPVPTHSRAQSVRHCLDVAYEEKSPKCQRMSDGHNHRPSEDGVGRRAGIAMATIAMATPYWYCDAVGMRCRSYCADTEKRCEFFFLVCLPSSFLKHRRILQIEAVSTGHASHAENWKLVWIFPCHSPIIWNTPSGLHPVGAGQRR